MVRDTYLAEYTDSQNWAAVCRESGWPVELLAMLEINIFFQAVAKLLEVTPKDDQVEDIVQFHRNLTILADAK